MDQETYFYYKIWLDCNGEWGLTAPNAEQAKAEQAKAMDFTSRMKARPQARTDTADIVWQEAGGEGEYPFEAFW